MHKRRSTGRQEKGTMFKGVESIIWMYQVRPDVLQSMQGYSENRRFSIEYI